MILGILMSEEVKIAILETQVERLLEKQKELTERVRANEKVVAAIGLFGSVAVAFIGAGYFAPKAEAEPRYINDWEQGKVVFYDTRDDDQFNVAHMGHSFPTAGEWIEKLREHESKKNRPSIDDMINSSLAEYEYGSNDPTEQEELLQFQSNRD